MLNVFNSSSRGRFSVACLLLCFLLSTQALAQTDRDKRISAAMVAINLYLLDNPDIDPDEPIFVPLGGQSNARYGYRYGPGVHETGLTMEFEGQFSDVEICFNAVYIQDTEVTVLFNGNELGFVVNGENCFTIPEDAQLDQLNQLRLRHNSPPNQWGITGIAAARASKSALGLPTVNRSQWDNSAVRKVLKVFAFGGHATDAQIQAWADASPDNAIMEMLNFSKHNLRLSPLPPGEKYVEPASMYGTFREFAHDYLSQSSSNLPIPLGAYSRGRFNGTLGGDHQGVFVRMANTRGLNPFRQRIALWETNYHLAVNLATAVEYKQMTRFYDVVMNAHESGVSYQQVMAAAAKSAAVALQYGHDTNQWRYDVATDTFKCFCNDDFAREIHQLYFGIFGADDPQAHENITIRNTSKLLTGMNVDYSNTTGLADEVRFSEQFHHADSLQILGQTISGVTASEKIDSLFEVSIEHPESLSILPIKIISGLADDNLSEAKSDQLRAAWASMGNNKNLLEFIRAYAISTLFHSASQRKYLTSFERGIYQQNKITLNNTEALLQTNNIGLDLAAVFIGEDVQVFFPSHNVFGGQTSLEAADSAKVFQRNFNTSTQDVRDFVRGASCSDCDFGQPWQKDWATVIPDTDGRYIVDDVAEWLWVHIIGNLDNYSALERAHLIPIIGALNTSDHAFEYSAFDRHFDLAHLLCLRDDRIRSGESSNTLDDLVSPSTWQNYCNTPYSANETTLLTRTFTSADLTNAGHIKSLLDEIGAKELPLDSSNPENRLESNRRIQEAVAFIFSTPFMFAEEKQ